MSRYRPPDHPAQRRKQFCIEVLAALRRYNKSLSRDSFLPAIAQLLDDAIDAADTADCAPGGNYATQLKPTNGYAADEIEARVAQAMAARLPPLQESGGP